MMKNDLIDFYQTKDEKVKDKAPTIGQAQSVPDAYCFIDCWAVEANCASDSIRAVDADLFHIWEAALSEEGKCQDGYPEQGLFRGSEEQT